MEEQALAAGAVIMAGHRRAGGRRARARREVDAWVGPQRVEAGYVLR